jgi:ubiquinone/menaquinone biosynthesis C-methylase UbiE
MVPETRQPSGRPDAFYLLGRTPHEYQRLIAQARWISGYTEHAFIEAGIRPAIRVLDIGCGVGDVSLLVAKLVGSTGAVVGIDQDPGALSIASERAMALGAKHVIFMRGDFRNHEFNGLFDAVTGRYVLMYQADPVAAIRSIMTRLRPGGLAVFQELDMSRVPIARPKLPLFEKCFRWGLAANRKSKVNVRMGLDLYRSFIAAGLPEPTVRMDTIIGAGSDFEGADILAQSMRSILPTLEGAGIASREEVEIDTLANRLKAELASSNGVVTWSPIVTVSARTSIL